MAVRIALLVLQLVVELFICVFVLLFFGSLVFSSVLGAPYVSTRRKMVKELLSFGGLSVNDVFYDLGCGDGRTLTSAVSDFRVKKAVGYEASLWPYLTSRLLLWRGGRICHEKVEIRRKNFFKADLSSTTFVYLYLLPKTVDRLAPKIAKETRSSTRILSVDFPINLSCHSEFELIKTGNFGKMTAYLYEKI